MTTSTPRPSRAAALAAPLLLAALASCTPEAPPQPEPAATNNATLTTGTTGGAAEQPGSTLELSHRASSLRAIQAIEELEIHKDVTCWTSFRQLDSFIATKHYSDFAVLTKIASIKALTRAVWHKASQGATGAALTPDDLQRAIPLTGDLKADTPRLAEFATELGMRNYTDYRKTSEHWRVVLAVIQDEVLYASTLKPLTPEAEVKLADIATELSLELLKTSGRLAVEARTPLIEAPSVREAHAQLAKKYALPTDLPTGTGAVDKDANAWLQQPTLALIKAKITALHTFNKTSGSMRDDMNRISQIPIDEEALQILNAELVEFGEFVARGYEPMRTDNFLADGSFAPRELKGKDYITAVDAENAIAQIIPHVVMPNGDIDLRFVPNPAMPSSKDLPEQTVRLLDYQMNSVRDTAIHWVVMEEIFKKRPFAMDPFAAEYLSENISMLMTLYLRRAQTMARQESSPTITADIARRVQHRGYVIVPPAEETGSTWTAERQKAKADLLATYPPSLFKDHTAAAGLKPPRSTPDAATDMKQVHSNIQTVMGAGLAVGDVNNDGFPDLFVGGEGLGQLYLNRGKAAPGTFTDATEAYGLPGGLDDVRQALFFDLDGDRDDDLLLVRSSSPSLLLRLDGAKYTDITADTGFATHNGAHSAAIFDHDRDGDLDLYIGYYGSDDCNHGRCPDANLPSVDGRNGSPNQLWRQTTPGKFEEIGQKAGVADLGWTLAVSSADLDLDGDLDLYLANDFGANTLLQNQGDGTFRDVTEFTHTGDRGSGMNVSFADLDHNGRWDIYVTNIDMFSKSIKVIFAKEDAKLNIDDKVLKSFQYLAGNKLYVANNTPGRIDFNAEENERFEPGDRGWSWAGVFFDVDNDTDTDLYLANGWISGSFADNQKNQLFYLHEGVFYLANTDAPEAFPGNSRAVAAIDLDRDGDLDLVANNFRQAPTVLLNTQPFNRHWLGVQLEGKGLNTNAVGALVRLEANGRTQLRQVTLGLNYLAQDEPVLHFGLGDARTANLEITWPDGSRTTRKNVRADEILKISP